MAGLGWTPPSSGGGSSISTTRSDGSPRVQTVGGSVRAYAADPDEPYREPTPHGSPGGGPNPYAGGASVGGGGASSPGGGGVPYAPPRAAGPANFSTDSTDNMSEVMQMYRDLIEENRSLSGEFNVEDMMSRQRAENSIQQREAEASGERRGGLSSAERRNMAMDQSRGMGELEGNANRSKLEFERGLLSDMGNAIGGASGMAGEEGRFLNAARSNEIDVWRTQTDYPLRLAEITSRAEANRASAMAQLAALV